MEYVNICYKHTKSKIDLLDANDAYAVISAFLDAHCVNSALAAFFELFLYKITRKL